MCLGPEMITSYLEASGNIPNPNKGAAFEDALSILSHRYNYSVQFNALSNCHPLFGLNGVPLQDQPFDLNPSRARCFHEIRLVQYYANSRRPIPGRVPTTPTVITTCHHELFNPTETSPDFVKRLSNAGTENGVVNPSTYDRYTFYRMLAQMGTDSDPDDGKMNLNYQNIVNGVVVPGMETNCLVWTPLDFFTSAADRMLRLYTTNWFCANPSNFIASYYGITGNYNFYYTNANGNRVAYDPTGFGLTNASLSAYLGWTNYVPAFGITNIPVYVNGQFVYSPAREPRAAIGGQLV